MSEEGAEKTEQPTERRLEQLRSEGRVATSRELLAADSLAAGTLAGFAVLPTLGHAVLGVTRGALDRAQTGQLSAGDVPILVHNVLLAVGPGVLGILVPAVAASVLAGLGMTRFNFSTEALEPKLERLDPFTNFSSQFLSAKPLVRLLKSAGGAGLVAWAVYSAVVPELHGLPGASAWGAAAQLTFLEHLCRAVLERAIPAALLFGLADFGWQWWDLSQQSLMTRQEVKHEHKDSDGDPLIKQRRRQRARQIAQNRQLRDVAKADVIVTNPTHYAIALRYRKAENAAPIILARGVDHVAMRIRAEAGRHDIPIIENRPLARALYAQGKVGAPVPRDLYGPVAKILAMVYRRRRKAT